ncbi:adenylyl-sulfate kinase [Catenovulum sediminis]|uniref:adenylyl-sulfate kinase n=1 Tax=Catenovulum sediminis TaxID=1740262 RepID=UPI001180A917|nr:adenylyl-sulfate kinase [Catenovulum sediminis]
MVKCFWITGLPGAGKSSIAQCLQRKLLEYEVKPILLDGDSLRNVLGKSNSHYDRDSRAELAFVYGRLCKLMVSQQHIVICATVSMFEEVREWNRANIPGYLEVFIDAPKCVLLKRNQKKLYSSGETNLPGVNQKIELPKQPDFHFVNDGTKLIDSYADILARCYKNDRWNK